MNRKIAKQRSTLIFLLRPFIRYSALMEAFRETFEFRRQITWLDEGAEQGNLVRNLKGAICSVLAQGACFPAEGLPNDAKRLPLDESFLETLRNALLLIPDISIEMFCHSLHYNQIPLRDHTRVTEVMMADFERYIRHGRAQGATDPGPW